MALAATDPVLLGQEIVGRIEALGAISETSEDLTRIFLSREHRAAADLLLSWMRAAGMRARLDAIGNVCGRYEGDVPGLPCLMLGSHYDTVRDAGKWDGPLGVITAISCVADLNRRGRRLPFAIEVVGFRRRGGRALRLDPARQPRGGRHLRRERARRPKTAPASRCARRWSQFGLDPDHIGAAARAPQRIAGLCRTSYRAGAGAGSAASAGRRRHRDLRRDAAGGEPDRHGRPCRHRADGAAPRCARGRRRMHRRDRGVLPHRSGRPGRHRRLHPCDARRHQRDSRAKSLSPWISAPPPISHRQRAVADIVRRIESIAKRPQAGAADRRHPRKPHRALRAMAEGAGRRRRRRRRFSRVRTAERRRP